MTVPAEVPGKPGKVGFIGLGSMGSGMAAQLVKAGYDVTVWSRTAAKADDLVSLGATRADGPEGVIATGHLFSMLADEQAVRAVCTPERLDAAPAGFIHVNHATISAPAAAEFARDAAGRGHGYVAAPVMGRPPVAAAGQLTILAAGSPDAVAATMPMLEVMGRRVWPWGPDATAANLAKIAVNYLLIHAIQALAESVTMLEHHDLDPGLLVQVIGDSLFPGPVYSGYGQAIVDRSYTPAGFTALLGRKDLGLALEAAADGGATLASGAVLQEIFDATVAEVGGDLDWAAIAEIARRRSRER